jgi:hypothetical protein
VADPKRERALAARVHSSAAKWRRVRFRDNRDPSIAAGMALGAGDRCWCGEERNHDWPGKDAGAPHPREEDA